MPINNQAAIDTALTEIFTTVRRGETRQVTVQTGDVNWQYTVTIAKSDAGEYTFTFANDAAGGGVDQGEAQYKQHFLQQFHHGEGNKLAEDATHLDGANQLTGNGKAQVTLLIPAAVHAGRWPDINNQAAIDTALTEIFTTVHRGETRQVTVQTGDVNWQYTVTIAKSDAGEYTFTFANDAAGGGVDQGEAQYKQHFLQQFHHGEGNKLAEDATHLDGANQLTGNGKAQVTLLIPAAVHAGRWPDINNQAAIDTALTEIFTTVRRGETRQVTVQTGDVNWQYTVTIAKSDAGEYTFTFANDAAGGGVDQGEAQYKQHFLQQFHHGEGNKLAEDATHLDGANQLTGNGKAQVTLLIPAAVHRVIQAIPADQKQDLDDELRKIMSAGGRSDLVTVDVAGYQYVVTFEWNAAGTEIEFKLLKTAGAMTADQCLAHFKEHYLTDHINIDGAHLADQAVVGNKIETKLNAVGLVKVQSYAFNPQLTALVQAVNDPNVEKIINLGGGRTYRIKYDRAADEFEILAGAGGGGAPPLTAAEGKKNFFAVFNKGDTFKTNPAAATKFRLTQEGYVTVAGFLPRTGIADHDQAVTLLGDAALPARVSAAAPTPSPVHVAAKIFEETSSRNAVEATIRRLAGEGKITNLKVAPTSPYGTAGPLADQPAAAVALTNSTAAIQITTTDNKQVTIDKEGFHISQPSQECFNVAADMAKAVQDADPSAQKGRTIWSGVNDEASIGELAKLAKTMLDKGVAVKIKDPSLTDTQNAEIQNKVRAKLPLDVQRLFDAKYAEAFNPPAPRGPTI